ncbi:uncharacterized protein PHALS_07330 [Plasmopara halstedii]|uniref:Uncharacterized protein n=1 Tax=Plasmopara halstedii TaxID=4781 RepID=A0A0P1B6Z1_PLAHL|nr:uncharacterized protein PHALS_07330 [Plasmopara halstedii]CEG49572.1 hypothetical protein PHALS_07330 [Plasmopara halstedii]|eukprot:XP_024585941.1 hypothetical protein PHALS_07330 [Plasmopara halstedii]
MTIKSDVKTPVVQIALPRVYCLTGPFSVLETWHGFFVRLDVTLPWKGTKAR